MIYGPSNPRGWLLKFSFEEFLLDYEYEVGLKVVFGLSGLVLACSPLGIVSAFLSFSERV